MDSSTPAVSIGVPVYNGEATLKATLESLLAQSLSDFEIIISDNASTDNTADICKSYAARDRRVQYFRQETNLGAAANFMFVLDQARAPYFMWAACDDIRSLDFLEENVRFLESHPDSVASTSPNRVEGRGPAGGSLVTFAIEGGVEDRFDAFLDHCWQSHGIFYAVIRTDVLRECDMVGEHFLAVDWAIDLYLARRGNIHRTEKGLMVSGASGISNSSGAWGAFRTHPINWVLPFYRLTLYAMRLSSGFSARRRIRLFVRLAKLNIFAAYRQLKAEGGRSAARP